MSCCQQGKELALVAHHILGIVVVSLSLYSEHMGHFIAWAGLAEFTNMPLSLLAIMQAGGMKEHPLYAPNGALLWAGFLTTRVISLAGCGWRLGRDLLVVLPRMGVLERVQVVLRYAVLPATGLIWALSLFWFSKITVGLLKALGLWGGLGSRGSGGGDSKMHTGGKKQAAEATVGARRLATRRESSILMLTTSIGGSIPCVAASNGEWILFGVSLLSLAASLAYWAHPVSGVRRVLDFVCANTLLLQLFGRSFGCPLQSRILATFVIGIACFARACWCWQRGRTEWVWWHAAFHVLVLSASVVMLWECP